MAKELGVSRPSVREAYSALEIAGILESKVGSGTYVTSKQLDKFFEKNIKDIESKEESPYEIILLRKIIEPEIVALAAKNASDEDIKQISDILDIMKSQIGVGKSYTLEIDSEYHLAIAKACGNSALLNVLNYILNLTKEKLWEIMRSQIIRSPEHLKKDIEYHEHIYLSIKNKDIKNARSIMKKHFNEIQKELEQMTV